MLKAFSPELAQPERFDWHKPEESLREYTIAARETNPQSIIVKLLESGILPVHPALNFIPTANTTKEGPQGVFIEADIADINLLRRKLLEHDQSPENERRINRKINRYLLLKQLDQIYDEIFISQNYTPTDSLKHDPEVVNAVFQILNELGKKIAVTGLDSSKDLISEIRRNVYYAFVDYQNKSDLLDYLSKVKASLQQPKTELKSNPHG